jgi:hypothetical protein
MTNVCFISKVGMHKVVSLKVPVAEFAYAGVFFLAFWPAIPACSQRILAACCMGNPPLCFVPVAF